MSYTYIFCKTPLTAWYPKAFIICPCGKMKTTVSVNCLDVFLWVHPLVYDQGKFMTLFPKAIHYWKKPPLTNSFRLCFYPALQALIQCGLPYATYISSSLWRVAVNFNFYHTFWVFSYRFAAIYANKINYTTLILPK